MKVPDNWKELPNHPLAELVEFGLGIDLNSLADHMRENGYDEDEPIILIEAPELMILDGRHKRDAANMAEETPSFRKYVGKRPEALVAKKLLRQHLDVSQRAYLAAKLVDVGWGGKRDAVNGITRDKAAQMLNVSTKSIDLAQKVISHGAEETQQALRNGTISASDAAKVSEEPIAVQAKAVRAVEAGKAKTAAKAAKEIKEEEGPVYPDKLIKKAVAAYESGRIAATERQLEVFAEMDEELQGDLMDSILSGRQTFSNAVEFKEVVPKTIEEEINEVNRSIEDFCRSLVEFTKDIPNDPWLDDLGRKEGAIQKVRDAAATLRTAKCQCKCPKCDGQGCAKCHKTGRVTKYALDMMGAVSK